MMHDFTVTFRNSFGKERYIGHASGADREDAHEQAWDVIMKFLDDHHYKSYYQRMTHMTRRGVAEVEWIDVGSHTEFFYIYPVDRESLNLEVSVDV